MGISRRSFLKKSAIVGAMTGFPTIVPNTVFGRNGITAPSDRVGVGLISCGSRSEVSIDYKNYSKSEIVAVCDPRTDRRLRKKAEYGNCADFNDFRDLLAMKEVDAVHISTSDHWHVPISLAAARAGKDMYTEKPLGKSIEQDLRAKEIVDKYDRIFQYGAQQRSMIQVRMGIELVLNGHIGDVKQVYVWCPKGEAGGSGKPVLKVADGFDYDLWLGPAPAAPFSHDRCLSDGPRTGIFHIYNYAIGFMAGWGAHPVDMLQWWADNAAMEEIPELYEGYGELAVGGLFDTLTHWDVSCTYRNGVKMRFMDDVIANNLKLHPGIKDGHGTLFVGSKGWVKVMRGGWQVSDEKLYRLGKNPGEKRLKVSTNQRENFIDCVLNREEPVDHLHSAIRSDIICHLADISVREGRSIKWSNKRETIVDDPEAAKRIFVPMREPYTLDM